MGKYNFNITGINPESTHGKILSKIDPGTTVLECGCASGYMTKYLHEQMNCTVDIVEIDKEAYEKALQYARNGANCDLDRLYWRESFDKERYDYILFADVLEHLTKPMKVLKAASDLLEPWGRIIVSIPNICHNDILIRMFYNRFTYTGMGLLDSTHIHFWGLKDFEQQCRQIGLFTKETDYVYRKTGCTEQSAPVADVNPDLIELLKKRYFGEVYQYLFVCEKEKVK